MIDIPYKETVMHAQNLALPLHLWCISRSVMNTRCYVAILEILPRVPIHTILFEQKRIILKTLVEQKYWAQLELSGRSVISVCYFFQVV